ncbi:MULTISPECIES: hypothetical protein [Luteibacter]|uniref:hypothetical protein n=1 Tax=Luteibacter TaxID=242605 RepID=UPI0012E02358|nr:MULTISPECIES: hypothetical protein [unclassified Luteibacter]
MDDPMKLSGAEDVPRMEAPDPTSFLAMHIMTGAAKNASATLDSLSGWMLAGFGAVLGLTISQLQGLSSILPPSTVRWAGIIYVTSVIPAFVAKVIAAAVAASAAGATDGMAIGEKIGAWGPVDTERLHREISGGTRWPLTWVNHKSMVLAREGDTSGLGRIARDRATMQMRLVLLQTLLTAIAGLVLILGLKSS